MHTVSFDGVPMEYHAVNTLVVGSGAAGLAAAVRLYDLGQKDVMILTEGREMGTSRNTGSDKQTYYKLSLEGGSPDSVRAMAQTLFSGGAMDGDIALAEAALSAQCFFRLAELGVPFPYNRYGEYAGYRTDHDDTRRATSAGPLTSRDMTECWDRCVRQRNIRVLDGFRAVGVLTREHAAAGIMALKCRAADGPQFALVNAVNTVYATGAPAGMYRDSVYPQSQTGAAGIALEAGVLGKNLTEWQYGIASLGFRWNLSGSFQQVLPAYVSTDREGEDARLFLQDYFTSPQEQAAAVFRKGYEWPFDPRKAGGSSLIDLAVFYETQEKGRRVFLDFRVNGTGASKQDFNELDAQALGYLKRSGATAATPVARLRQMNPEAYALYRDHGIDLEKQPLEIAVCAQHNNGGLSGNLWWESNLPHFFPVGEANGTHGVYRPGGSALNAGQVGALRAARYIRANYGQDPPPEQEFLAACRGTVEEKLRLFRAFTQPGDGESVWRARDLLQGRMSRYGAHIRSAEGVSRALCGAKEQLGCAGRMRARSGEELVQAYVNYDMLVAQVAYLEAMQDYIGRGGGSRGSYLIEDEEGEPVHPEFGGRFRHRTGEDGLRGQVQQVNYRVSGSKITWRPVRPLPEEDGWFESVWERFRSGQIDRE